MDFKITLKAIKSLQGTKKSENKIKFAADGFIQINYTYLHIFYPHNYCGKLP